MIYIVYVGDLPDEVRTTYNEAKSIATEYAGQLKAQGRDDIPVTIKCVEEYMLRDVRTHHNNYRSQSLYA